MATNGFQGTDNAFQLTGNAFQQADATLVEVPDVVGQSEASGTTELEAVLFVVSVVTDYSPTVPIGDIISQSPIAGTMAVEGSTVTITVSLGVKPAQTAAGSSRHRRRYYVEVDGHQFLVDSVQEATELLQRARAIAERRVEVKTNRVVKKLRGKPVPPIKLPAPKIITSAEIAEFTAPIIKDIQRLYSSAEQNIELRLLLEKQMNDDDEEDLLLLL